MKKKNNKKGFTLAELLIVVAIIAVLVAIAIPIFTTQLEKSRDTVTVSNLRAAYAQAASEVLTSDSTTSEQQVVSKGTNVDNPAFNGVAAQLPFSWGSGVATTGLDGTAGPYTVTFSFDGDTCTVTKVVAG